MPPAATADAVLLGGGGAGLAVLHHVALALLAGAPRPPVRVVVVDPLDRLRERPADRTWCSWDVPTSPTARALAPAVHRSWPRVHLVGADGAEQVLDLAPLRYAMVRSEDWYAVVAAAVEDAGRAGRLEVTHLPVAAQGVTPRVAGDAVTAQAPAVVVTPAGPVTGRWVLDSRPAPPRRPGATSLLQHFAGERVRTAAPSVDPARAVLMDFSVPQPPVGLAFGYVLPSDARTALVEYTEFSPAVLDDDAYAAALGTYRDRALTGPSVEEPVIVEEVEHVERGAIAMTDAPFLRRCGPRTWRLGAAGGAVRPASGYAFAAMQRQARVVAAQLVAGTPVHPPRPYPRRHAWTDAVVLRALADGSLDGPGFFTRLFARNPPARVLGFLDGLTSPTAELALMASAPRAVMVRAVGRDAAGRVRRRLAR